MADDKNKQDGRDRNQVGADQTYEINYVAQKHNVSPDRVKEAIAAVGNDREQIEKWLKNS
jgi:hypothetical protein